MTSTRIALILGIASTGLACERPFVDVRPPEIEIVEPDPREVVTTSETLLRVRATSFRAVSHVEVDGQEAMPDGDDTWSYPLRLEPGLNRFVIRAHDVDDVPGVDTLLLMRFGVRYESGPVWSGATGGHAATVMPDGRILVTGGSSVRGEEATAATWWLDPSGGEFVPGPDLVHARTGHTATLLPDGSVVVMGGSRTDPPARVADLVEAVEIMPSDGSAFTERPVSGDPVRRAFHTATLRATPQGPIVDLLGGTGDVRYGTDPRVEIRDDIRSFLVRPDSVAALNRWFGIYVGQFTGHTQTALDPAAPGTATRFLLSGALFGETRTEPRDFVLYTADPRGLLLSGVPPPDPLRTEHAAVRIAPGRVLIVGGRTPKTAHDLSGTIYDDVLENFIRIPAASLATPHSRRRPTATLLPDGRILLMGGYDLSGQAQSTSGYLYID